MANIKRLSLFFVILLTNVGYYSQTITASPFGFVSPGITQTAQATSTLVTINNCNWTSNCGNITFAPVSSGNSIHDAIIAFNVPRTTSCSCINTNELSITVTFTGTIVGSTTSVISSTTFPLEIWPIIVAKNNGATTNTIAPTQTLDLVPEPIPGNSCGLPTSIPLAHAFNYSSNSNGLIQQVSSNVWHVSCSSTLGNQIIVNGDYGVGGNAWSMGTLSLNIKLIDPALINPHSLIGCGSIAPYNVIFSVTPVTGASSYSWTYPNTLLQPVGSVSSSTIAFDAINLGTGQISVQALGPVNTSITSNAVYSPVFTICCIGVTSTISSVITPTDTPYLNSSGKGIVMNNTIQAYAGATVYATNEVQLAPGFEAIYLSSVHVYNDNCGSVYFRKARYNRDSSNIKLFANSYYSELNKESVVMIPNLTPNSHQNSPLKADEEILLDRDFIIYPNPNSGSFTILKEALGNEIYSVSITDTYGRSYLSDSISDTIMTFQLNSLKSGVYFVNITYKGIRWHKKMIVTD